MALLAFSAFLHCDELVKLCCCDVVRNPSSMSINLPRSKTDQYREGSSVVIAQSGTPTCPVAVLEQYFTWSALGPLSANFLFQDIVWMKNGEKPRNSGHISHIRERELMLQRLSKWGYDATQFSMHSFRAGGATAAANAGVPDRLFKHHGCWCSESAKDGYVKDLMQSRLSVFQSLNL